MIKILATIILVLLSTSAIGEETTGCNSFRVGIDCTPLSHGIFGQNLSDSLISEEDIEFCSKSIANRQDL
ncbi:MAG: hypothetical protein OXG88_03405 [Gammaproteobacteria bacterium]|nr:hypothetical protein [Gammaproteobacteria bacterium]